MADKRNDDYQPLAFYETHKPDGANATGFFKFAADGLDWFAYQVEGRILLISQGYRARAGRDNGIVSTRKNMALDTQYVFAERGPDGWGFDILARNRQQVATSAGFASREAAVAHAELLQGKRARLPATRAASGAVTGAAAGALAGAARRRAPNVEQNYKPLGFYAERIQGVENGFDTFVENGQHYFTLNRDGEIALISEGYPTAAARDRGIASVETNLGDASRYSFGDVGGGYEGFRLRARNNKEIARSPAYQTAALAAAGAALLHSPKAQAAPPEVPVAPVAAVGAAAGAGAAALAAGGAAPAEPEPVAAAPAAVPAAAATTIPVAETGGGIWGWLKWLLLFALLAALLFGLLSVCNRDGGEVVPVAAEPAVEPAALVVCWNGSEAESQAACPERVECADGSAVTDAALCPPDVAMEPDMFTCADGSEVADVMDCPPVVQAAPVEVETVATAGPTPAIATGPRDTAQAVRGRLVYGDTPGSCACAASDANLFTTAGAQLPVVVTRLGTNPEFGNHQGRSAGEFFQTLQNRYASDAYDRTYLDYLARSLGYGGFGEMDASMFSETSVPNDTRVMLGYGSQHALQYSELALRDSADNSAFRVRSANGCDVNFMKTCGNFAYVCE